jgi:predicted transcriptional regulator
MSEKKLDYEALRESIPSASSEELKDIIAKFQERLNKIEEAKQQRPDLADALEEKANWTNDALKHAMGNLPYVIASDAVGKDMKEWEAWDNYVVYSKEDPQTIIQNLETAVNALKSFESSTDMELSPEYKESADWLKNAFGSVFGRMPYMIAAEEAGTDWNDWEAWDSQIHNYEDPGSLAETINNVVPRLEKIEQQHADKSGVNEFTQSKEWLQGAVETLQERAKEKEADDLLDDI